jgi:hypothetical protein
LVPVSVFYRNELFFDLDEEIESFFATSIERRQSRFIYFRSSCERANLQVDISGLDVDEAAQQVKLALEATDRKAAGRRPSERPIPGDAEKLGRASWQAGKRRA